MRKTNKKHGIVLTIIINILMNLEWSIPAIVLLILHFAIGISFWWFILGLAVWIIPTLIFAVVIGWATADGVDFPEPTVKVKLRENEKNPFEVKQTVSEPRENE